VLERRVSALAATGHARLQAPSFGRPWSLRSAGCAGVTADCELSAQQLQGVCLTLYRSRGDLVCKTALPAHRARVVRQIGINTFEIVHVAKTGRACPFAKLFIPEFTSRYSANIPSNEEQHTCVRRRHAQRCAIKAHTEAAAASLTS